MVSDLIGFPDLNDQGRQVGEGEGSRAPIGRPFYVSDCLSRVSNWSSLSYHRLSFTQKQPSHTQQLKGAFKKRDKKALGSKGGKKAKCEKVGRQAGSEEAREKRPHYACLSLTFIVLKCSEASRLNQLLSITERVAPSHRGSALASPRSAGWVRQPHT